MIKFFRHPTGFNLIYSRDERTYWVLPVQGSPVTLVPELIPSLIRARLSSTDKHQACRIWPNLPQTRVCRSIIPPALHYSQDSYALHRLRLRLLTEAVWKHLGEFTEASATELIKALLLASDGHLGLPALSQSNLVRLVNNSSTGVTIYDNDCPHFALTQVVSGTGGTYCSDCAKSLVYNETDGKLYEPNHVY